MLRPKQVADVMTRDPLVVSPADSARTAHAAMVSGSFRHLPVVDGGRLVGIISMSDLGRLGPTLPAVMDRSVAELMSKNLLTIEPDASIEAAAALMGLHKVSSLPVLRVDELVGIVTSYDLLEALASRLAVPHAG